jgi:inositol-1,3,4-trisphosphate 5/6-kinase/inositol-tetrakisphosphate 1-kinase
MGTSSSELSESMTDVALDAAGPPGPPGPPGSRRAPSPRSAYVVQPDPSILREIGLALKSKLNLDFFNFDLIRVKDDPSGELLIVDINYFPGISKMPGFSDAFCQFLLGTDETPTPTTGGGVP